MPAGGGAPLPLKRIRTDETPFSSEQVNRERNCGLRANPLGSKKNHCLAWGCGSSFREGDSHGRLTGNFRDSGALNFNSCWSPQEAARGGDVRLRESIVGFVLKATASNLPPLESCKRG